MPSRKKNERIMLILIGAAVIAFVILDPYHLFRSPPEKAVQSNTDQAKQTKKPADPMMDGMADQTGSPRMELKGWRRDPFEQIQSDIDKDAMVASLRLTAISVWGADRMAMINSKPVRVGDEVQGLQVTSIESGRVKLEASGQSYTLTWER